MMRRASSLRLAPSKMPRSQTRRAASSAPPSSDRTRWSSSTSRTASSLAKGSSPKLKRGFTPTSLRCASRLKTWGARESASNGSAWQRARPSASTSMALSWSRLRRAESTHSGSVGAQISPIPGRMRKGSGFAPSADAPASFCAAPNPRRTFTQTCSTSGHAQKPTAAHAKREKAA